MLLFREKILKNKSMLALVFTGAVIAMTAACHKEGQTFLYEKNTSDLDNIKTLSDDIAALKKRIAELESETKDIKNQLSLQQKKLAFKPQNRPLPKHQDPVQTADSALGEEDLKKAATGGSSFK